MLMASCEELAASSPLRKGQRDTRDDPNEYEAGGVGEEIHFAIAESSLGAVLDALSARVVLAILMGDDPNRLAENLQDRFP